MNGVIPGEMCVQFALKGDHVKLKLSIDRGKGPLELRKRGKKKKGRGPQNLLQRVNRED